MGSARRYDWAEINSDYTSRTSVQRGKGESLHPMCMDAYLELLSKQKDIETIGQISGLLGWDQEVMMPPKAAPLRAEQLAWLSKTRHGMMTDSLMGDLLSTAEAEDDGTNPTRSGNLRLIRDAYDKSTKQPTDFVERLARHKSKSIVSWAKPERRTISPSSAMIWQR